MPREQSKSQKLATRVIYEALKVLKENGGSLKGFEVITLLRERMTFNERESERYEKTG